MVGDHRDPGPRGRRHRAALLGDPAGATRRAAREGEDRRRGAGDRPAWPLTGLDGHRSLVVMAVVVVLTVLTGLDDVYRALMLRQTSARAMKARAARRAGPSGPAARAPNRGLNQGRAVRATRVSSALARPRSPGAGCCGRRRTAAARRSSHRRLAGLDERSLTALVERLGEHCRRCTRWAAWPAGPPGRAAVLQRSSACSRRSLHPLRTVRAPEPSNEPG